MKKTMLYLAMSGTLFAGFNFDECAGSGSFEQEIISYQGHYEQVVDVGEIPKGIQGLHIELSSEKDVDIRLYGEQDEKIVHWPEGILNQSSLVSRFYKKNKITYSGYNGNGVNKGYEFISVQGSTPSILKMKAFGYEAGYAVVKYSWTGKDNCTPKSKGKGAFNQNIHQHVSTTVGEIPKGISNLSVTLNAANDIDMQLFSASGKAIVSWKPQGLLSGPTQKSISYNGMKIEWSGYEGVNGKKGNEYIKISGNITEALTLKVYGYETGEASVNYHWGEKMDIEIEEKGLKSIPTGLFMRGKTKHSYCDLARGDVDGGYCQIAWADLEPVKGEYDFSLIDNALAKAKAYNLEHHLSDKEGFKVLLRVRTGVYSPEWVKKEAGSVVWFFKHETDENVLPLFWEKKFQGLYKDLMITLAKKYDDDLSVGSVAASMCMTKHTEIMWNRTGRKVVRETNMEALRAAITADGQAAEYSNEKDYECLEEQVKIHRDIWTRTPTIFGSHIYQVYDYDDGSKTKDYALTLKLFDYCVDTLGMRCVLGNNSLLHTENNTDYNINRALSGIASKGYATYYQTHVFKDAEERRSFNFENLQDAMFNAASWGAYFVELPMGWDCAEGEEIDTKDKTTCSDAAYKSTLLQEQRKALKANVK